MVGKWLAYGWQMEGLHLANGRPAVGQWLANGEANGWPMVGQLMFAKWLANAWLMICKWLANGLPMVGQWLANECFSYKMGK